MRFTIEIPADWAKKFQDRLNHAVVMAIRDTAETVRQEWVRIASERLRSTYHDYASGLYQRDSIQFPNPNEAIITLRGKWPNMLEQGFPPFDMKKGFARSEKAKRTKDGGWYLNIPFRHLTPNTTSAIGGRPMPPDIYARARRLQPGQRLTGTEAQYPPQVSWTGYQHKNGFYEGMIRNVKQYGASGARQSTYYTFRRVSDKSDPKSWWHPGFEGVHAVEHLKPIAKDYLQQAIYYYLTQG